MKSTFEISVYLEIKRSGYSQEIIVESNFKDNIGDFAPVRSSKIILASKHGELELFKIFENDAKSLSKLDLGNYEDFDKREKLLVSSIACCPKGKYVMVTMYLGEIEQGLSKLIFISINKKMKLIVHAIKKFPSGFAKKSLFKDSLLDFYCKGLPFFFAFQDAGINTIRVYCINCGKSGEREAVIEQFFALRTNIFKMNSMRKFENSIWMVDFNGKIMRIKANFVKESGLKFEKFNFDEIEKMIDVNQRKELNMILESNESEKGMNIFENLQLKAPTEEDDVLSEAILEMEESALKFNTGIEDHCKKILKYEKKRFCSLP